MSTMSLFQMQLEDDPDEGLISNCWEMTGDDLREIFKPIIEDIVRLVDDPIRAAHSKRPLQKVKGIFLVGGFGSSRFLKGENLKRDQRVNFGLSRTLRRDCSPDALIFIGELLYSETETAPVYPGNSVKTLCKLRSDLRHVNKSTFEEYKGADGNMYIEVKYDLFVCTTAANLKFSLEINGKEMGGVEATYI